MTCTDERRILEKFRQLTQKHHVRGFHVSQNRDFCIQLGNWKTGMPVMRIFCADGNMDMLVSVSEMGIAYPFDALEIPACVNTKALDRILDWLHVEADRIYEEEIKPLMYNPGATKTPPGFVTPVLTEKDDNDGK